MEGMASYKVTKEAPARFTAHVTRRGGSIDTRGEFPTELAALDWVGERLGLDIPAGREA
jgi:hypothetical protein